MALKGDCIWCAWRMAERLLRMEEYEKERVKEMRSERWEAYQLFGFYSEWQEKPLESLKPGSDIVWHADYACLKVYSDCIGASMEERRTNRSYSHNSETHIIQKLMPRTWRWTWWEVIGALIYFEDGADSILWCIWNGVWRKERIPEGLYHLEPKQLAEWRGHFLRWGRLQEELVGIRIQSFEYVRFKVPRDIQMAISCNLPQHRIPERRSLDQSTRTIFKLLTHILDGQITFPKVGLT